MNFVKISFSALFVGVLATAWTYHAFHPGPTPLPPPAPASSLPSVGVPVPTRSMQTIATPVSSKPASTPLLGDTVTSTSTQLVAVAVSCPHSEIYDLYDTPSGNVDPGYYDASGTPPDMSTTTYKAAHKIGRQAYTLCADGTGNQFILPLTVAEYAALAAPDAGTPQKTVLEAVTQ